MAQTAGWLSQNSRRLLTETINRALAMDPAAQGRLASLSGQRLRLELDQPAIRLDVYFGDERVEIQPADDTVVAHATVETTLGGLMSLAASRGERSRDVVFRGDIGTIQAVKTLATRLEIDWEEQLSRVTGDALAHRIGQGARGGRDWLRYAGNRFLEDIGEYATEEAHLLPTAAEVDGFSAEVRQLRSDVDRLEARLKRLQRGSGA
jgi:ubiquinone biosynthesis protein UbiJ